MGTSLGTPVQSNVIRKTQRAPILMTEFIIFSLSWKCVNSLYIKSYAYDVKGSVKENVYVHST